MSLGWIASFAAVILVGVLGANDFSRIVETDEFFDDFLNDDDDLEEGKEEDASAIRDDGTRQNSECEMEGDSLASDNLESNVESPLSGSKVCAKMEASGHNEEENPEEMNNDDGDDNEVGESQESGKSVTSVIEEPPESQVLPRSLPTIEERKPEIISEACSIRKRSRKMPNVCRICDKSFRWGKTLVFHIRRVHSKITEIHRCGICKASFSSYTNLRYHKLQSRSHLILRKRFLKKQQRIKREPVVSVEKAENDETKKQKKIVACSSKTSKPEVKASSSPYNLRLNRKRSFKGMADATDSKEDGDPEASDTDSTNGNKRAKIFCRHCHKDGHRVPFRLRTDFQQHKKLHLNGRHKCSFCKIIKSTVAKLSEHERRTHSTNQIDSSALNETLYCPRCPFETRMRLKYMMHFAEAHIPGFERLSKFVECEICKQKVSKTYLERHRKAKHDTAGVDPSQVVRCKVPECPAFFVGVHRKQNMYIHQRRIHLVEEEELEGTSEDEDDKNIEDTGDGFVCKFCNRKFSKFSTLKAHQRTFHRKRQGPHVGSANKKSKFVCPVIECTETFPTQEGLQGHQKLHGSFKCEFCDVVKDYAPELAIHESEQHSSKSHNEAVQRVGKRGLKYVNCARCPSKTHYKSAYVNHFLHVHLQLLSAVYRCPICQTESIDRSERFQGTHFQRHHNTEGLDPSQIFDCDQCPAYFIQARQLVYHKIDFHFGRKCPECGKSYKGLDVLRHHIVRAHPNSNAFPNSTIFSCDVGDCLRVYMTKGQLDKHKADSHAGSNGGNTEEKYFHCQECPRKFNSKAKLSIHVYSAHSKLSFVCPECGKVFKTKLEFESHMLYHKGPEAWKFQCSTCGRKLATKQKLEQHQRTHTKEKPFICQYCGEKYAHQHNWRNHVKTKHPEEYEQEESESGRGSESKNGSAGMLSRKGSKRGECILAGVKQ